MTACVVKYQSQQPACVVRAGGRGMDVKTRSPACWYYLQDCLVVPCDRRVIQAVSYIRDTDSGRVRLCQGH